MAEKIKFNLEKIIEDAKCVLTKPAEFYREMPQTGGFAEPCIFLVMMAFISGAMATLMSFFGLGSIGAMAIGLTSLVLMPVMALIGSFIGALIMFVIWKLMGSSKEYEAAYRCVAYTGVIYPLMLLVGWMPYVGTIISLGLGMYLMYVATIEVHEIPQKTAQMVIGIIAALILLMQLSSEHTMRSFRADMEQSSRQMEMQADQLRKTFGGLSKNGEEVSPEEAGKAIGEFFKGLSDALPKEGAE